MRLQPANALRLRSLLRPWTGGVARSVEWVQEGGRLLLAAGGDGVMQVFELVDDQLVPAERTPADGVVLSLGWARKGGRLLVVGGGTGGVQVFELVGEGLVPRGEPIATPSIGVTASVGWVQEGERLLLVNSGGAAMRVFELVADQLAPRGEPVAVPPGVGGPWKVVRWVRDGRRVLLAGGRHVGVQVFELVADQLVPRGEPVATPSAWLVLSMGWVREGGRLLLAAGGAGHGAGGFGGDDTFGMPSDVGVGAGVQVFELVGDQLVPRGEPVATPSIGVVLSVEWAREGSRLLLAAGGAGSGGIGGIGDSGAGVGAGVQVFELVGDQLVPCSEPVATSPLVRQVMSVRWVRVDERLLLAVGGERGVLLFELEEVQVVPRLPAYRSDAASGADELARSGEAMALAELLTATSARPPLAVGLFGEWGQGKSHFLELLEAQVAATARPDNRLAAQAVRQVRFNAWHYAETGLWPSLVAELFTQLAAPGDGADPGAAQRSLSALSARLVDERQFPQRLRAAEGRLADLTQAVRRSIPWDELPAAERAELIRQAGDVEIAARLYTDAAAGAAVVRETLYQWSRAVIGLARRPAGFLFACAVAAGTAAAAWVWLPRWTVGLPVLASLLAVLDPAGRLFAQSRTNVAEFQKKLQGVLAQERSRIETAARLAAEEVAALKRQMQDLTAAGQLAGLVEDRAGSADYRSRLGVMTHIREDFRRMAALLAQASDERAWPIAAGKGDPVDTLPRIDRILLYIDDLDRCPPGRVVEMLEAIHLLLAVDLFVVVVAIDPRWLLAAIAVHYREVLEVPGGFGDGPGLSTPAQYLEKIFQVVFTLPPLETDGYQRLLRSMITMRGEAAPQTPAPTHPVPSAAETSTAGTAPDTTHGAAAADDAEGLDEDRPPYAVPYVQKVRVVERTDPLMLTAEELELLDLLGPPLMVTDPRSAKRLANSYGLLTALRRGERKNDLEKHQQPSPNGAPTGSTYSPYRAGMVLLAALVAYPAMGPALCLDLHQQALDAPEREWREFCEYLARPDEHAQPPAHPGPGPQRQQLSQALLHVTDQAHGRGLDLPHTLDPWREWVMPAARLSFPAGQAIDALYRQKRREAPTENDKAKP
jgi:hypothetical protein